MHEMLKYLSQIDYVHPEDIPDIDLYMDQVTTFIDQHLSSTKRYPSDKLLTKSMINNYAKNNLLPPPQKKKYNKEHILTLAFIYYFKNILRIPKISRQKMSIPLFLTRNTLSFMISQKISEKKRNSAKMPSQRLKIQIRSPIKNRIF